MKKLIMPLRYLLTASLFLLCTLAFFDEDINPYKIGFWFVVAMNNLFFLMFEEVEVIFGEE